MWIDEAEPPTDDFRGIQFWKTPGFQGQVNIYFTVNDNGFSGKGGACSKKTNHSYMIELGAACYPFCGSCCLPYVIFFNNVLFESRLKLFNSKTAASENTPCTHTNVYECNRRGGFFMASLSCNDTTWSCKDELAVCLFNLLSSHTH